MGAFAQAAAPLERLRASSHPNENERLVALAPTLKRVLEVVLDATPNRVTIPPRTYWYHVPESAILGVEVAYRRSEGAGIGFVYNDDPDVDDEPSLAVA